MLSPTRYTPSTSSIAPFPTGEDVLDAPGEGLAFRAWVPPSPILVLGNSQVPDIELNVETVLADGIPVYQRKGGGGAVLLAPGCVCLAVRFPKRPDWGIHDYFAAGNQLLSDAVGAVAGLRAEPRGISDLAVLTTEGTRKISGSSLYMPRGGALYLASLLVSADISMWDRYLKHPSREPDYRAGRGHGAFVANVSERASAAGRAGVTAEAVRQALSAISRQLSGKQ
jgi:lipoate-protein ligase A